MDMNFCVIKGEEEEMGYLRKSAIATRLQRLLKHEVTNKMQADKSIVDSISRRQRKWYGHLRIDDVPFG